MRAPGPTYKWIVLSNTTIGMLLATINSSILLIALPDIFRGIHINPLAPIKQLLGPALAHLPHAQAAVLTRPSFFPKLMTAPFSSALSTAFTFSFIACLVAAGASWLRGGKYHHREEEDEPRREAAPPHPTARPAMNR